MYDEDLRGQFPNLFHILVGYLDQDFALEAPTLDDAVYLFIDEAAIEDIAVTRAEIAKFLDLKTNDLDAELERLGGLYSREPGMNARDYLFWLDGLLAEGLVKKQR